jgi:Spy/CpxP family protein refolding chaperone
MKRSLTLIFGMALAGVLATGMAYAQDPAGPGPGSEPRSGMGPGFGDHRPPFERALGAGEHGRWWNNPKVVERLKLTDTQRKAMDDTLQQHRETLIDLRGSLEKSELELEPMMKQDQPKETQILAQIDKVAQARAELEKANARFLLAIRSKLTPDQWKQMEADRAQRIANRPSGAWQGRGAQRRGEAGPGDANAPPPPGGPQSMDDGGDDARSTPPPPRDGAFQ